ncbi:Gfo/Idh/MocA family oxidoreductase [bacterium]|nr:Gfo/Idh/MocA family oxidoreductase [bacterium]
MKVAVVGIGKMGMLHAGILNGLDGIELCAITETTKFLLGALKSLNPDLQTYTDYETMLDDISPDAVVIATPVHLHVPIGMACARRNIPFFMEKPLSLDARQAEPLLKAVKERNLPTMVGYMLRYVETYMKAKEIIDSGVLGSLITFRSTIYVSQLFKKGEGWRYSRESSGGGVVIGQGTHLIDLLKWFFGPAIRVNGHTRSFYSSEVEDFAHVNLAYKSGLTGWMDSSWSVRHHRLMQVEIHVNAENGTLTVTDDFVKLFLDRKNKNYEAGWTQYYKPDLFEGVEIDLGGPFYTRQLVEFIDAVKKNREVEGDIRNAYEVQRIVDAIYKSAQQHGAPVDL